MSNNPQPSLRENLIPVFMKFGSKFDPIEQPETVNPITDEAIDAILQLFESTMLEVIGEDEPHWINYELSANAANVETLNRHCNELRAEQRTRLYLTRRSKM